MAITTSELTASALGFDDMNRAVGRPVHLVWPLDNTARRAIEHWRPAFGPCEGTSTIFTELLGKLHTLINRRSEPSLLAGGAGWLRSDRLAPCRHLGGDNLCVTRGSPTEHSPEDKAVKD
jgi:hypothetical protein